LKNFSSVEFLSLHISCSIIAPSAIIPTSWTNQSLSTERNI